MGRLADMPSCYRPQNHEVSVAISRAQHLLDGLTRRARCPLFGPNSERKDEIYSGGYPAPSSPDACPPRYFEAKSQSVKRTGGSEHGKV